LIYLNLYNVKIDNEFNIDEWIYFFGNKLLLTTFF